MGLSSTTNRVLFTGDGSSTVFAFPYYFFQPSDLQVYLYNTGSSIVLPQTINTNYTISGSVNSQGVYPSGGNVVMASAVPTSLQLVITRSPSPIQNYALAQNQPISALATVQQFDYLTALVQRLQDEVSRCLQLADGLGQNPIAGAFSTTLPSQILLNSSAGAPLVVNSGATGFTFGVVATGLSSAIGYAGVLPVVNGGTGQSNLLTAGGVPYALSPTAMAITNAGGQDQVLIQQSSGVPAFAAVNLTSNSSSTGALSAARGGTGLTSFNVQFGILVASSTTQAGIIAPAQAGLSFVSQASSFPQWAQVSLSSGSSVVGTLPSNFGGTGNSSFQDGQVLIGNSNALFGLQASSIGGGQGITVTNLGGGVTIAANGIPLGQIVTGSGSSQVYAVPTNADVVVNGGYQNIILPLPTAYNGMKTIKVICTASSAQSSAAAATITASSNLNIIYQGTPYAALHYSTPQELWTFVNNSGVWTAIEHFTETAWSNTSVLSVQGSTSNPSISGSSAINAMKFKRHGQYAEVIMRLSMQGAGAAGSGDYLFSVPGPLTIDSSQVTPFQGSLGASYLVSGSSVGSLVTCAGFISTTASLIAVGPQASTWSTTQLRFAFYNPAGANHLNYASTSYPLSGTNTLIYLSVFVPILNWEP